MGLFEVLTSGNEKKSNTKQNLFESLGLLEEDNNKKNDTKQNLLDFLGMSEEDKVLKEKLEKEMVEKERLEKAREREKNSTLQDIIEELEQQESEKQISEKQLQKNIIIFDKEILEGLNEEKREEYQRLKGIENLAKTLGKEVPKNVKMKLEKYRKNVVSITDFREKWKERIEDTSDKTKEKIIKASENIKVNVKIERDGSRLIELEISGKVWKLLYPNLNANSDDKYKSNPKYDSITYIDSMLRTKGMRGDDVEQWKNQKLKEYVKDKQKEGLHIPTRSEIRILLGELGKKFESHIYEDQLAMLMYLTGMDGRYILSNGNGSEFELLQCTAYNRSVQRDRNAYRSASLFMIACE